MLSTWGYVCAFGCGFAFGCVLAIKLGNNNFVKISGESTVAIGDKVYTGTNIEVNDQMVIANGEKHTHSIKVGDIHITGNPQRIETVGNVKVTGNVNTINATGNVDVTGNCYGNISTIGTISIGNVSTKRYKL